MTDIIAITKLRDVQCLGLRKSLPCTCILYLFHLKDLQRRFAGGGCCNAAPDSRIKYDTMHAVDAAISFFDTR